MISDKTMLVIDDEDSICLAFRRFFESRGWRVYAAASAAGGLEAARKHRPGVVFVDVRLPDRSGLDVLEELASGGAGVVVITAYGGLDTVVQALQGKAFDYLVKPLDLDKALSLANRVIARPVGEAAKKTPADDDAIVGSSPAMHEVYKLIARAAPGASPVLIQGQTGTGKELAARAIHRFSPRRDKPFLAVNCGAIPASLIESELFGHVRGAFTGADDDRAGRFEAANEGTLLLDEVGDLPPGAQVKLLRVLDTGAVERVGSSRTVQLDVRILAATNKDLAEEVRAGRFRQDLYYRLAVLRIVLPALRDRREDIIPLAEHFLARWGAPRRVLSSQSADILRRHDWPGNVRELRNAIEHALAVCPGAQVLPDDLPESVRVGGFGRGDDHAAAETLHRTAVDYAFGLSPDAPGRYHRTIEQAQRALIIHALERFGGNQSEAADYLGLHRNTLRNKLRELGIDHSQDR